MPVPVTVPVPVPAVVTASVLRLVVRERDQPPVTEPKPAPKKSLMNSFQVPFGGSPLKTEARVAVPPPAGPGWL